MCQTNKKKIEAKDLTQFSWVNLGELGLSQGSNLATEKSKLFFVLFFMHIFYTYFLLPFFFIVKILFFLFFYTQFHKFFSFFCT